jgi:hypothetical protein
VSTARSSTVGVQMLAESTSVRPRRVVGIPPIRVTSSGSRSLRWTLAMRERALAAIGTVTYGRTQGRHTPKRAPEVR